MRPLREYTARELLHFRPVLYAKRDVQHAILVNRYLRQAPRRQQGDFKRIGGRNLLITIAFNFADVISWQRRLIARFLPDCLHLVADNSSNDEAARSIENAAGEALYLRLPPNPWGGTEPKSHGFALNYCWRFIVRPYAPTAFGFVDHDMFPLQRMNPFAALADYPIAGRVWPSVNHERWHLWGGFCFFRTSALRGISVNFDQDFFAGLDTGGRNWRHLYRYLCRDRVPDPGCRDEIVELEGHRFSVQWIGSWLHRCNHGYDVGPTREAKNRWIWAQLDKAIDSPGMSDQL